MAAPVQWRLTRTFPLVRPARWRRALIHLAANATLAFALIVTSCFRADWAFEGRLLPSLAEVSGQLVSTWTLLVFALCAFTVIAHLVGFIQPVEDVTIASVDPERATRVTIKVGGRLRFVEQANIDWLESQGNYLALHNQHAVDPPHPDRLRGRTGCRSVRSNPQAGHRCR